MQTMQLRQTETVAERCSRAFDPYTFCHVRPAIEVYSCILMALFSCFPVLGLAGWRVGWLVAYGTFMTSSISSSATSWQFTGAGEPKDFSVESTGSPQVTRLHLKATAQSVFMGCSSKIQHGSNW